MMENKSLFGKIKGLLNEQSDIRDICDTLAAGHSPLAVSGLSSVHKSQLAMLISHRLYGEKNVPLLLVSAALYALLRRLLCKRPYLPKSFRKIP